MLDLEQERNQLHTLIDHLSARQIVAVRGLLDAMLDPFEHKLVNAEIDDEPVSPDEYLDIEATREWSKHNKGTAFEEVIAEFGLSMDEVRSYQDPQDIASQG